MCIYNTMHVHLQHYEQVCVYSSGLATIGHTQCDDVLCTAGWQRSALFS